MQTKTPTPQTFERMRSVKAACESAPVGPKRDRAFRHYHSAERAESAKHDGECNRQLDSAVRALE